MNKCFHKTQIYLFFYNFDFEMTLEHWLNAFEERRSFAQTEFSAAFYHMHYFV